jgi:TPR repeat protein
MIHLSYSKMFISLLSATLLIGFSEPTFAAKGKNHVEKKRDRENSDQEPEKEKEEELLEANNNLADLKNSKTEGQAINDLGLDLDLDLGLDDYNLFELNPLKRLDPDHRDSEEEDELAPPNKNVKSSYNYRDHLKPMPFTRSTPEELRALVDLANAGDKDLCFKLIKSHCWEEFLGAHSPFFCLDLKSHVIMKEWMEKEALENDFYAWYVLTVQAPYNESDEFENTLENLEKRAKQGNPIAQYVLSAFYYPLFEAEDDDEQLSEDIRNHEVFLLKSAESGFVPALFMSATVMKKKFALITRNKETLELSQSYLNKAVQAGYLPALVYSLLTDDSKEAKDLFFKKKYLADQGLGSYQVEVALDYYVGENVNQSQEKAFEYLEKVTCSSYEDLKRIIAKFIVKLNFSHTKLIEALGRIPNIGDVSYELWKESNLLKYLRLGVQANHAGSMVAYGKKLWDNSTFKKDSLTYWEKAANLGCHEAFFEIGLAYLNGLPDSLLPDVVKRFSSPAAIAKKYFQSAVKGNSVSLVRRIGSLYWEKNTLKDREEAWFFWSTIPAFGKLLGLLIGGPSQADAFPLSPLTLCSLDVKVIDEIFIKDIPRVMLSTIPLMEFMLSDEKRNLLVKTMRKLHEFGYVQEQGLSPEELMNNWVKILRSDNLKQIEVLADFIPEVITDLGLMDRDELYVETVNAGIRLSQGGTKDCIYGFFNQLKEKHAQFSTVPHNFETIEDMPVRLNIGQFQTLSQRVYHAKDLPDVSFDFEAMCNHLEKQGSSPEFCQNVLTITGKPWEEIRTGSLGSQYLKNLLKFKNSDDIISPTRWKFIRSIEYLKETYPDVTECEFHFVKMLAGIQNCQTGKNDGIANYYSELQRAHGQTNGNSIAHTSNMNQEKEAASDFITELCLQKYENVMRGIETPFLCEVVGLESGKNIPEISHHVLYVTSLLGSKPVFDPYSHVVSKTLVDRSKQEVSDIFFKYFTCKHLISSVIETSEKDLKFYGKVLPLIEDDERNDAFDINTDTGVASLTPKGAIKVLRRTGFLDVEDKNL